MKCRICSKDALLFDTATVLQKHRISYFKCDFCGYVQTEEPFWLQESYAAAINRSDVGIVERNVQLAKTVRTIISLFFKSRGKFIDYGGGYGLFVRLMRDYGFDFYWNDRYCKNLLAKGFEAETSGRDFELLTAFEVMEHLTDPVEEMRLMLNRSRNILFTTLLLPRQTPKTDAWWYYELDYGQHVSFYTVKSLSVLADTFDLKLYSDGRSLHLMTKKNLSSLILEVISYWYKLPFFLRNLYGRKSLIFADYKSITGKDL